MKTAKFLKLCLFTCFVYGFFFSAPSVHAGDSNLHDVLFSAESLFKAMKERNYAEVWKFLTARSKTIIVDDVYRAEVKLGSEPTKKQLNDDFASGGATARTYWNSYMKSFDPDMVLEQSTWKINVVKKDYAEINILYVKSDKPAMLQLFKEDGMWKVGLQETFRLRKWIY